MDDSMGHVELWDSNLTATGFLGTAPSCNDRAELAHLNNPQPAGESAAAYTGRKQRGRKPTLSRDEKRSKKNARDKIYRKDHKAKFDRLMKIAYESGGIDEMASDFERLKQMKSRYGGFEEIESKLEQREAESAVFEKVKTMFGGIENIEPGLDRLKKTEFMHAIFRQNPMKKPLIDFLSPSSDSPKDLSNRAEHSANSINQGSNYSNMVREYEICDMSLAIKTSNLDYLVTDFIAKLEIDTRSNVDFSSFKDLGGKRQRVEKYSFPMSLVPTVKTIMAIHGDVTRNCQSGPSAVENPYILLCAAIKEIGDLPLKQVTKEIMFKWRDAIRDAQRIDIDVEFAWGLLKTIARACFGLNGPNFPTCYDAAL